MAIMIQVPKRGTDAKKEIKKVITSHHRRLRYMLYNSLILNAILAILLYKTYK